MAQLSFTLTSLMSPVSPSQVCTRSSITPLLLHKRRSPPSSIHQNLAFSDSRFSPYPNLKAKSEVKASDFQIPIEDEEDKISSEELEDEAEGTHDDEHEQKLQAELKEKADKILKDAILDFAQSDIADAAEKYGMEEELFAEIDFAQINAFADRPFAGNPAAVCYLPLKRDDRWLQLVAREFNLSETAFLMKRNTSKRKSPVFKRTAAEEADDENPDHVDEFDLRWFTPKFEVNLCGHATLASAHLLFSSGIAEGETLLFHTRSGVLKAKKISGYENDKATEEENKSENLNTEKKRPIGVGVVELDFPIVSFMECDDVEIEVLSAALGGAKIVWVGKTSSGDYLVEVSSSKEIYQLRPSFSDMLNLPCRGVIVTSQAEESSEWDFVSRFFCPKAGVPEDPVTGSAHCTLGPFWSERLDKTTFKAYQASERGGKIDVRVDKNEGRVYLQGSAVLVMAGVLLNSLRA